MAQEIVVAKPVSPLVQYMKNETAAAVKLREGEVFEVTLMAKMPRYVFFDMGKFGTGIIYGAELQNARGALKTLEIGSRVPARIECVDGRMGYVELSLSEAGKQKVWQQVVTLEESGELVPVKITGANQGGLTADLMGLKAFLPASQLSPDHAISLTPEADRQKIIEGLKKYVGEEFTVKVITANQRMNKLIVSERETTSTNANLKEALAKYTVGQDIDGVVSGIADFGIFVKFTDNPEIEGLVHISEIDHKIVDSPKEIVSLNESVKVKIIDIREGRVFLSLKALKPDPWAEVGTYFKEGTEVEGKVQKFNPFGAIINLDHGLQGMVHISEFGGQDEMKTALVVGQSYSFVIGAIRPEEKRIILKAKK